MSLPARDFTPDLQATRQTSRQSPPSAQPAPFLRPFVPRRWLGNPHLQTVVGNFLRREHAPIPAPVPLVVPVEPPHRFRQPDGSQVDVGESSVLCLCHWQPARETRLTVVLVHGLEGSARSGYILGNTARLWAEGCNLVRMNMRSCGGSDALSPTIYHSGRSEDVAALVAALGRLGMEKIALVGYSMGGNLVLRYAGQQSLLPPSGRDPRVCAAVGVSPLLDLAPSSAALHLPSNRLYERRFLRAMKRRLAVKARLFPALYGSLTREKVFERIRTIRDFDGAIVARYGGFNDADDYYEQVRSSRYAADFALPTLLIHANDDPFIRTLPATREALRANPRVRFVETSHGGHCAFLADPDPGSKDGGRWAEETVARWLLAEVGA